MLVPQCFERRPILTKVDKEINRQSLDNANVYCYSFINLLLTINAQSTYSPQV